MTKTYHFSATVWLYPGKAAWHFVTLPTEIADNITFYFSHVKRGWGSLPVSLTARDVTWQTSIFPDKKTQSYLLPLKAKIRQQLSCQAGDTVQFELTLTA